MSRRRGFTLIESLAVIAIIGILASIVTVSVFAAQRQARDTRRKSDLTAISFGFEARYNDRLCSDPALVATYPVYGLPVVGRGNAVIWTGVSALSTPPPPTIDCSPFSDYMKTIPNDTNPYKFNLSSDKKHFRLAAVLERDPQTSAELGRQSDIWEGTGYNGKEYSTAGNTYNYFIGR